MSATGFIRYPDGRSSGLTGLEESEFIEQILIRSIIPKKPWSLLPNVLPVGEGLSSPLGTLVPILGLEMDGTACAVLLDLKEQRAFASVLGEALSILHWLEKMNERELETFARYFWQEPHASLRATAEKNWGVSWTPSSIGGRGKVYLLTVRSLPILLEIQSFLHRQGLPIQALRLHTLKGQEGETVAVAETLTTTVLSSGEGSERKGLTTVGDGESFLQSLTDTQSG